MASANAACGPPSACHTGFAERIDHDRHRREKLRGAAYEPPSSGRPFPDVHRHWPEIRPARLLAPGHLRHRVLPIALRAPAEHEQVAARGGEVVLGAAVRRDPLVAAVPTPQQPRPARAERQDHDERVLGVAHVAVAMERLAVVAVSVPDEREAVEGHAVLRLDRALRLEQHGMRDRLPGAVSVRDARFLDPTLVAPEPARRPRHRVRERVVRLGRVDDPATRHVDPRAVVEPLALERDVAVDAGRAGLGAHLRQGTDCAGARGSEKRKTANVEHAIVVEIPKGSRNKYEMDHDSSAIWLDRTLFTAMQYPADYGFFPDTLAEDGDPLDALVLLPEPTFPGCHIMIRAVAVFWMSDEKGPDAKVLCVPAHDPRWDNVSDLPDVPEHLLHEIEHFFDYYKTIEPGKGSETRGWEGAAAAEAAIADAKQPFTAQCGRVRRRRAVPPRNCARASSSRGSARASASERRIGNHGSSLPQRTRPR